MKKEHRYRITVEYIAQPDGTPPPAAQPLVFEVGNHDEILGIVERVKTRPDVPAEHATAFAVGLKLLGEVLLRNRELPLFDELGQAFKAFMQKFKRGGQAEGAQDGGKPPAEAA